MTNQANHRFRKKNIIKRQKYQKELTDTEKLAIATQIPLILVPKFHID